MKQIQKAMVVLVAVLMMLGAMIGLPMPVSAAPFSFSIPSSGFFNTLWVGDVVSFGEGNIQYEIISGDCAEIISYKVETESFANVLKFKKAGSSTIKVIQKDGNNQITNEHIYAFTVIERPANKPVSVKHNFSSNRNIKFGEIMGSGQIQFENLNYGFLETPGLSISNESFIFPIFGFGGSLGAWVDDGTSVVSAGSRTWFSYPVDYIGNFAFKPGKITIQPICHCSDSSAINVGQSFSFTVEAPVITDNAPTSIKEGSTLNLTTALTNAALKNLKVAHYENNIGAYGYTGSEHMLAYKPTVTVIEGQDLLTRSSQDYSNTLSTSENITFNKTGTVKLKVSYNQIVTTPYLGTWSDTAQDYIAPYDTYNPEKIITINVTENNTVRAADADRIETAIETSKIGWEKSDNVVLVNSQNFPDALAGGPLAYMLDAPILLVKGNTSSIESSVLARIVKLEAKNIYILGGESVVNKSIFDQLKSLGYNVTRLSGNDRYETAIAIAKKMDEIRGTAPEFVFIADALNFPDALSITPVAGIKKVPILFTPNNKVGVNGTSADYITKSGVNKAVMVGGTGVVKPDVEAKLQQLGLTTDRVAGENRFETSAEIYKKYKSVFTGDSALMATGMAFPDALGGGALGGKIKSPLLLVNGTGATSSSVKSAFADRSPKNVYVLGGTSVVTETVVNNHIG